MHPSAPKAWQETTRALREPNMEFDSRACLRKQTFVTGTDLQMAPRPQPWSHQAWEFRMRHIEWRPPCWAVGRRCIPTCSWLHSQTAEVLTHVPRNAVETYVEELQRRWALVQRWAWGLHRLHIVWPPHRWQADRTCNPKNSRFMHRRT